MPRATDPDNERDVKGQVGTPITGCNELQTSYSDVHLGPASRVSALTVTVTRRSQWPCQHTGKGKRSTTWTPQHNPWRLHECILSQPNRDVVHNVKACGGPPADGNSALICGVLFTGSSSCMAVGKDNSNRKHQPILRAKSKWICFASSASSLLRPHLLEC